jgi:hypothetical protein
MITAQNMLNALQFNATGIDGGMGASGNQAANESVWAKNWLPGKVSVVVDPYIPYTATSNKNCWFLFASPLGGARPAMELDYLAGHDNGPELFQKAPNSQRMGGSAAVEDFETDTIWYKVRHTFGTVVIDPKLTFASTGNGS